MNKKRILKNTSRSLVCMLALSLSLGAVPGNRAGAQDDVTAAADTAKSNIDGVDFIYDAAQSRLEIKFDRQVAFEKIVSDADRQVILEFKNAVIAKKFVQKLDTSAFKSNVTLISPYQNGENVRVVMQLREEGSVDVSANGNTIVAYIDNKLPASSAEPMQTADASATTDAPAITAETPETEVAPTMPSESAPTPVAQQSAVSSDGSLQEFMKSSESKHYTGRRISLQLKDADIKDVFQAISEASEFNIVLSDDVKGRLTVNLNDVPWDQALDIILKSNKLAAERNGNVLRVASLDEITKEKQAELANIKAVDAVEPLVVKIFPISYAKIEDLKKILDDFLSQETQQIAALASGTTATAATTAATAKRGSIQIDSRTNSLIVRDTANTIEKVKRILKELDTQTPQILIEAKFVEVSENNTKELNGKLFLTTRETDSTGALSFGNRVNGNYAAGFQGSSQTSPAIFPDTMSGAITPVAGATFGIAPKLGILPGLRDIAAFLNILESESNAKIIATPRVMMQNKEEAEISQGTQYTLPTAAGANTAGGFQTINATLSLKVLPQVTSDGSINMKVAFSQDSPSPTGLQGAALTLDSKKVNTSVLVDSGGTLVIGGIYSSSVLESRSGIPFLRDLPLIGIFFGSKGSHVEKRELFIFLTPRVVNDKEAGLQG